MRSLIVYGLLALAVSAPVSSHAETLKLRFLTAALTDDKGVGLKTPEGVACDASAQNIVVADTEHGRLVRYTLHDRALKGGAEIKVAQIVFPVRVQLNSKGNIFVLDGKQRKIVELNPQGAFVGYVTPQAKTAPATVVPKSFKVDGRDNIFVLDISGERVLQLDPTGKTTAEIPFPKEYGAISDVGVTPGGDVLILDSVKAMVYVAKKDAPHFVPFSKSLKDYLNFATSLSTSTRSGDVFLIDQDGGSIIMLGADGSFQGRQVSMGWKIGQLYYPAQMCMDKDGDVIIADKGNSRVQVFENLK